MLTDRPWSSPLHVVEVVMPRTARAIALILACLAPTAWSPAVAQTPAAAFVPGAPCPIPAFQGFPLNLNLGLAYDGRDGISDRCGFQSVQGALNALSGQVGQPNGTATLDGGGKVPLSQVPASVALPTAMLAHRTAAQTNSSGVLVVQNADVTADQIAAPTVPAGWFNEDGVRVAMSVFPDTTAINTSSFAYYMRNRAASSGHGKNAVGMQGIGTCEVDGCATWALNPVLIDAPQNGVIANNGRRDLNGIEIDYSVTSPNTSVVGVGLLGSSYSAALNADGFLCGALGGPARWTNCVVAANGQGDRAVYVGTMYPVDAAHANTPSQKISYGYVDGTGGGVGIDQYANVGALTTVRQNGNGIAILTTPAGGTPAIVPTGQDANMNLQFFAVGTGSILLDSPVRTSQPVTTNSTITANQGVQFAASKLGAIGAYAAVLGTTVFCTDCREPGQAANAGTGILITYNGSAWRSAAGGPAQN